MVFSACLFIALLLRFYFFYPSSSDLSDGDKVRFTALVVAEPRIKGSYQFFSLNPAGNQEIDIISSKYPMYHAGDFLEISGTLRGKNREENISLIYRLLNSEKTDLAIFFPKIELVEKQSDFPGFFMSGALALSSSIRQKARGIYASTLPPTSSGLLMGMVFGVKEQMPKQFDSSLRVSGVLHVIAASGMNVAMIAGVISSIFSYFLRRQTALYASALVIVFYAFLAGLEPSIIRASIMALFAFGAQILGRQNKGVYALFATAFVMLFVSPSLLFDIGFQLSFLSTLGILTIKPLFMLSKKAAVVIKKSFIGDDIITSFAAQIGTLPILLGFGSYSLWSLAVNGLVLWVVPIVMAFGGLAAVVGIVFEPLGKMVSYLTLPFLLYFEFVVSLFGRIAGSIPLEEIPWEFVFSYYFLLFSVVIFMSQRFKTQK